MQLELWLDRRVRLSVSGRVGPIRDNLRVSIRLPHASEVVGLWFAHRRIKSADYLSRPTFLKVPQHVTPHVAPLPLRSFLARKGSHKNISRRLGLPTMRCWCQSTNKQGSKTSFILTRVRLIILQVEPKPMWFYTACLSTSS